MTVRPSAEEVDAALEFLRKVHRMLIHQDSLIAEKHARAVDTLRLARAPQRVGAAKDVSLVLGVEMGNLDDLRGLPEPWRTLPRPTAKHPERVSRLWDMDEIEAFAAVRRAKREGVST